MPLNQTSFFDNDPDAQPPSTLRERVLFRIEHLRKTRQLSIEDEAVLGLLVDNWMKEHITQRQIAASRPWLGCHPEHEVDVYSNRFETTTRRVRSIVRHLKIGHKIPILSGTGKRKGYYLPETLKDAEEYMERMERQCRAAAASYMVTYYAMRDALDIRSQYFEQLGTVTRVEDATDDEES